MLWKHQQKFHCLTVIKRLFFFLFLLCCCSLIAQVNQEKVSLVEALHHLEKQFSYHFNYAPKTIEGVLVSKPPENISFQQAVAYLESQTSFKFTILPNKFVSITNNKTFLLCGYIKDSETKMPVVSASIQSAASSIITDKNGYFETEVASENEMITIRHLGFKTLRNTFHFFKNDTCSDIELIIQTETLPQVIITNYIAEGISKLSDGTFQINFSNFNILPGLIEPDVLQTILALPGIQSINETVSNINIRGGSHDENLILWDGIKMYQAGHFFGLISVFNPQITNKVSLQKNGTRVDYSDGVSGTISMNTNDNVNAMFKGSVGMNFVNLDVFTDIPLSNKSSIQVAARNGLKDFLKTPTYKAYFDRILQDTEVNTNTARNIEFDFNDISLRWLYEINDKNLIRVNFITIRNELEFNETAMINSIPESRKSILTQNSLAGGLYYEKIWSDNFRSEIQFYETDYKLKGSNANIEENQRFRQENKVSETGTKLNTFYTINDKLTILNGYEFIETQIVNFEDVDNPVYSLYVGEVLRKHGLYSQLNYSSKNNSTNLNIGIRANYIGKFDKFIPEPRISFNQKIKEYLNLEILGEFKHQTTSQIINFQNDFLGVEERRWQLSNNENIPVITSKQISLGLQYHKKGWLINAEGYYKKVDGITTQSQGFQNQYLLARTDGNYQVTGLDFLIKKQFNSLNTWLSYSFANNHYIFKALQNASFPNNFDIVNSITFGSSYSINNFNISAGINWHSGKPTTNPVIGNEIVNDAINYEPANNSRLSDYFRLDFSTTYSFNISNNTKADVGLSILNVSNHNNYINNYFRINNAGLVEEVLKSSLKFTPNISFRVSF
jgi:hypothetical protein